MTTSTAVEFTRIPLIHITVDPDQPRRHFDEEKLQELADSIKANGVIQPITVVPFEAKPSDEGLLLNTEYRVLAGERRFRASMLAGAADIPAVVRRDLNADQIAVLQAIENFQRENLSFEETCTACETLVAKLGLERAAEELGKSKPWVSLRARVNSLPERVLKLVRNGRVRDVQIAHLLAQILEIDPEVKQWSSINVWADFESVSEEVSLPNRSSLQLMVNRLREVAAAANEAKQREAERRKNNAAGQGSTGAPDDDEDGEEDTVAGREQRMLKLRSREESPAEREERLLREARNKRREELEKDAEPILRGCMERLGKALNIGLPRGRRHREGTQGQRAVLPRSLRHQGEQEVTAPAPLPRAEFPGRTTVKDAMQRLARRGQRLVLTRAGLAVQRLH